LAYADLDPALDAKSRIAGGRAYSSSKLCVLLTARALARRPEASATSLSVVAYDPGPTPGTGLVRSANFAVRSVWWVLGTPLLLPFLHNLNSRSRAGGALAELALGATRPDDGKIYAALRRGKISWPELSELASRDDVMEALWKDSADLVGLSE